MNLYSPFFKMDVSNVFIVYNINVNAHLVSYSENPYYYEYGCTYKLYIRINNKKKIVYYNEEDHKYYDIVNGAEVEVKSPAYASDEKLRIVNDEPKEWINESFYGYPIPFKKFFKDEIGSKEMEEVSVRKAISMFQSVTMNEEEKESIELSTKPYKAARQLKEYCDYNVKNNMSAYDKVAEMQDKIEELFEVDSAFSNEAHKKVEELIEKYNKSVKENKPHFSIDNKIELKFESLSPLDQLIDDLEKLYYKYSSQLETIRVINELEACKELIEKGIDNDKINGNIIKEVRVANSNLKYLSFKEYANKKSSLLSIIENEIKDLNDSLYSDDNLIIDNQLPIEIQIKSVIDDINVSALINKPYVELRDAFLSEDNKYIDGKEISELIISIKFIIDKIDNETLQSELKNEFATIKEEYTSLLGKMIESEEKQDFKEIEIRLRKRLEPFLKKLDFSTNKKLNQIMSSGSLLIQLDKSLYIISRNDYNNKAYDKIDEPITRSVIELLKMSDGLEDRQIIINEIVEAIYKKKEMMSKITINNYSDYKKYRNDILRSLMKIKLYVMDHKGELIDYSKNIIL